MGGFGDSNDHTTAPRRKAVTVLTLSRSVRHLVSVTRPALQTTPERTRHTRVTSEEAAAQRRQAVHLQSHGWEQSWGPEPTGLESSRSSGERVAGESGL